MAHSIRAAILKGDGDHVELARLGLHGLALVDELTIFPLSDELTDALAASLRVQGFISERPRLNSRAIHRALAVGAPGRRFAIIETDYFGGTGDQAAAVYEGDEELMAPVVGELGPINTALHLLGVKDRDGDAFQTIGLTRYRSNRQLLEAVEAHARPW